VVKLIAVCDMSKASFYILVTKERKVYFISRDMAAT